MKWNDHQSLAITRHATVGRDEYLDHMTFQANRRPLFTEIFGPLIGLKEEWLAQGATESELDFSAFSYRCPAFGGVPVNLGWIGGPEPRVIEDNDHVQIYIDRMGRRMRRVKRAATLALPETYPVTCMADWLRVKPHYEFSESRFANDWQQTAQAHLDADRVLSVGMPGGYDQPRQLMGEENLALACYEEPELIDDILQTIGDTAVQVLERVGARVPIDQLKVHEDMAGRGGPMFGPNQVQRFIAPYYRRVWEAARRCGARVFDQDSDGDLRPIIPAFLDAGVNVMHPMEPAAGMDIVELRQTYGQRLAFYGGLDKHVLRRTQAEIEAELEYKLPPLIRTGGCMFGLDHRVPNGTPLANYHFYVDKVWQIMERETAR